MTKASFWNYRTTLNTTRWSKLSPKEWESINIAYKFSNVQGTYPVTCKYFRCNFFSSRESSDLWIYCSSAVKDAPGHAVPYAFDGAVKELLNNLQNKKSIRKLFYQTLAMPLHELENKKPFKVRSLFHYDHSPLNGEKNWHTNLYNVVR